MHNPHVASEFVANNLLVHEILSKDEEYELIAKAQRDDTGSQEARDRLVLCNMRFIYGICMRWCNLKDNLSPDELLADGVLGYLNAIDRFDISRGVRLNSFAGYCVMTKLSRSSLFEDAIRLPSGQKQNIKKINMAMVEFIEEGIVNPSTEELSEKSGVPVRNIKQIQDHLDANRYITLDSTINYENDGKNMSVADVIEDPSATFYQQQHDVKIDIEHLLSLLPDMHSFVLATSFGIPEKWTLHQLGIKYGKSRERMRQIKEEALHALKTHVRLTEQQEGYITQDGKEAVKLLIKERRRQFLNKNLENKKRWEEEQRKLQQESM